MDLVVAANPSAPATQPLATPLTLRECARYVVPEPILLDEHGDLWVTKAGGSTATALKNATADLAVNTHIVSDRVLFAWWLPDNTGDWRPNLIVPADEGNGAEGKLEFVPSVGRRQPFGSRADYQWHRAKSWTDGRSQRLVVPTARGVSVFTFRTTREPLVEAHQEIVPASDNQNNAGETNTGEKAASPLFLFDANGLIAWSPPTSGRPGSGACRFTKNAWTRLGPSDAWPANLLHVIPLRDGSVTQLLADDEGVRLAFIVLDPTDSAADRKAVMDLVSKLADDDPAARESASKELAAFGPGVLPILRDLKPDDIHPAARSAVRGLLRQQTSPQLGGLGVRGEHLRLVRRFRDGGVLFHTADGVSLPNPAGDEPIRQAPAWISARPGRPVEVLPAELTADLTPESADIDVINGRWVVRTDARGPRLITLGLSQPLVRKAHQEYSQPVGVDRRGRWLFRKPDATDAIARGENSPTFVIDPMLPDFTPRLPAWVIDNKGPGDEPGEGTVGWDKEGWPAMRQGTAEHRLLASDWAALVKGDKILTEAPPRPDASPAAEPASTRPAYTESSVDLPLVLVDSAGAHYFGGNDELEISRKSGQRVIWKFPDAAVGEGQVTLIEAAGRFFLFNQPGRVMRLRPTPDKDDPFVIEASFARDIPSGEEPRRIWLDPAGRIVLAMEEKLIVLFPTGFIPRGIREKMSGFDMEDEDPNAL